MKRLAIALVGLASIACARGAARLPDPIPVIDGKAAALFALEYIDIVAGTGAASAPRRCHYVHYTGWLTDGKKFDSSRDTMPGGRPREPISFPQSYRRVIAGWDLGFEGMKVGGRRRLLVPYQLAYGEAGRPPVIPPRSTLVFDVELMAIADTIRRPDSVVVRPGVAATPSCAPWRAVSGS